MTPRARRWTPRLAAAGSNSLQPPRPGAYFIEVRASAGASDYLLRVGPQALEPAVLADSVRLSAPFVPGEVLVRFRAAGLASGAREPDADTTARALGLQHGHGSRRREMRLRADTTEGLTRAARRGAGRAVRSAAGALAPRRSRVLQHRLATLALVKTLRQRPDVAAASVNHLVQPAARPNDPYYADQWHYRLLNLEAAWDIGIGSPEVVVAVVDTGVVGDHPDLWANLISGYDFISDPSIAVDGDGIDPDSTDPGDQGGADGASTFHGTHVAGTIGALSNNDIGVAGVAWETAIMPVRVLGRGGGTVYDVLQGVRYAAGMDNDSGTVAPQRADIVNLSLASSLYNEVAAELYREVREEGILVVAAAGNDGDTRCAYPACYADVLAVSAVGPDGALAPYSNYGSAIDLAAPGGNFVGGAADGVLSTLNPAIGIPYAYYQGTSMATAHVSGVLALMRAEYPALDLTTLEGLLSSGTITSDTGAPGRDDRYGWGLLDAGAALAAARELADGGPAAVPPRLAAAPRQLDFSVFDDILVLRLSNAGAGELTLRAAPRASAPWLVIEPIATDANGLGAYRVGVDRTWLTPGVYAAQIVVDSSAGPLEIAVGLTVTDSAFVPDAGQLYVHLADPLTDETIAAAEAIAAGGGQYSFTFDAIPPGDYLLIAGSDANANGLLCDLGEACGAYPVSALPQPVQIGRRDRDALDFDVGYRQPGAPER